jgi:hypothetical protein
MVIELNEDDKKSRVYLHINKQICHDLNFVLIDNLENHLRKEYVVDEDYVEIRAYSVENKELYKSYLVMYFETYQKILMTAESKAGKDYRQKLMNTEARLSNDFKILEGLIRMCRSPSNPKKNMDYSSLTVVQLKALCTDKGLKHDRTFRKLDYVNLLEADDLPKFEENHLNSEEAQIVD